MVVAGIVSLASGIGMNFADTQQKRIVVLYDTAGPFFFSKKKESTRQPLRKLHKHVVCTTRVHDGSWTLSDQSRLITTRTNLIKIFTSISITRLRIKVGENVQPIAASKRLDCCEHG